MAGSPPYTANVSLGSAFSEHKILIGNITCANSATAVVGSGTRFTSELKIEIVLHGQIMPTQQLQELWRVLFQTHH